MAKTKTVPISARVIDDYVSTPTESQPRPAVNNVIRDSLYDWYWKMPEVRANVSGIIADVFGEGYGLDGDRMRQQKANRFLRQNRFNSYSKSMLRDTLISGDGYLGKASLTESQVFEAMDAIYTDVFNKAADPICKTNIMNRVMSMKPDIYSPKVLFPLMSRGMYINYDVHGRILGYIQKPKGGLSAFATTNDPDDDKPETYTYGSLGADGSVKFLPQEVIHYAYEPIGDQIYGTSPLQTAIYDVISLWYAKTYGGLFFQNDATPSFIFNLPDDSPDSENYKKFCEEIKKHRQNPHRHMVTTGNLGINKVAAMGKDLEFSNFIDKFTQRLMLAYGTTARFNHLFGGKADTPATLEGYFKGINNIQTELEDLYNNELFDHFNVEFYFKRVYKRDETREADIAVKLTNLVWTINESREYLGFKPIANPMFDELPARQQDEFEAQRGRMEEVASADARTRQNATNMTSRNQMKGDKPVNGDAHV